MGYIQNPCAGPNLLMYIGRWCSEWMLMTCTLTGKLRSSSERALCNLYSIFSKSAIFTVSDSRNDITVHISNHVFLCQSASKPLIQNFNIPEAKTCFQWFDLMWQGMDLLKSCWFLQSVPCGTLINGILSLATAVSCLLRENGASGSVLFSSSDVTHVSRNQFRFCSSCRTFTESLLPESNPTRCSPTFFKQVHWFYRRV